MTCTHRSESRAGTCKAKETHAIGEVSDQVLDLHIADLKFAVEPVSRASVSDLSMSVADVVALQYHLPKVFSCTLTQLCSSSTAIAGAPCLNRTPATPAGA